MRAFTFHHHGKSHTFERAFRADIVDSRRAANPTDAAFSLLEALAGPEALAVIDEMTRDEFLALAANFARYRLQATRRPPDRTRQHRRRR